MTKYYLAYGSVNTFTIKHRTMKILAHDKEKYYLDADPSLTYEIDTRVCDSNNVDYYNKDYRCTFAPNSGDYIGGELVRYKGPAPIGIEVWDNNGLLSDSEIVWYDGDGNLVPREINIGTLKVYETYNGGYENYIIDFEIGDFNNLLNKLVNNSRITLSYKVVAQMRGDNLSFSITYENVATKSTSKLVYTQYSSSNYNKYNSSREEQFDNFKINNSAGVIATDLDRIDNKACIAECFFALFHT